MERAGTQYKHLFKLWKIKIITFNNVIQFFLFKLIKSLIVLVFSNLWYASFPYKITSVLNFLKLITST